MIELFPEIRILEPNLPRKMSKNIHALRQKWKQENLLNI